jgi:predicted RNase H-like HicB family nuclease
MKRLVSVVIEKDADGYFAFCPELQRYYTQGDSYEEVLEKIRDAIRLHIADMVEDGSCTDRSDDGTIKAPAAPSDDGHDCTYQAGIGRIIAPNTG